MKNIKLNLLVVALLSMMFVCVGILIAADVPDDFMIQNEGYKKDKKGPVPLSHKKHSVDYKVACTDCHHEYDKDKNNTWKEGLPVKKCSECHNPKVKKEGVMKLQNAYHRNCKNCHKKIDPESKKAPSKKCAGCHAKK